MVEINSAEPHIWGNKIYNENISRYVTMSSWFRGDLPELPTSCKYFGKENSHTGPKAT